MSGSSEEGITLREVVAEFVGTLSLVLSTDRTVATARLARSHGYAGRWITIAIGSAFAVIVVVGASAPISGEHVDPAVTLGLAASGWFACDRVPDDVVTQMLGGFIGVVLVRLVFWPHWSGTVDSDMKRGVFCTSPAIRS